MNLPTGALRAAVSAILKSPHRFDWTVHGLGMIRTHMDDEKKWRLNIWHRNLRAPMVSAIHDHPWHLESIVVAGCLINTRYAETYPNAANSHLFKMRVVGCGRSLGGIKSDEDKKVWLARMNPEHYTAGQTYRQLADEIHDTAFDDFTVTINKRTLTPTGDSARVFYPDEFEWVDASPRRAGTDEAAFYAQSVLNMMAQGYCGCAHETIPNQDRARL